jgi:hypothetical protein
MDVDAERAELEGPLGNRQVILPQALRAGIEPGQSARGQMMLRESTRNLNRLGESKQAHNYQKID